MKQIFLFLFTGVCAGAFGQTNLSMQTTFSQYVNASATTNYYAPSHFVQMSTKEGTEGSPFLLENWTAGNVTFIDNKLMTEPTTVLNFDKMTKGLVLKMNENSMLNVDMSKIQSFQLENNGKPILFKRLPGHGAEFYQLVYADSNYSLYKSQETKFFKADYVNKGLLESGSKFDRYVDEPIYYILAKDGAVTETAKTSKKDLKKLSAVFPNATAYSQSKGVTGGDAVMTDFVKYLNQANAPAK